jgi:hypothetical protein
VFVAVGTRVGISVGMYVMVGGSGIKGVAVGVEPAGALIRMGFTWATGEDPAGDLPATGILQARARRASVTKIKRMRFTIQRTPTVI